MTEDDIEAAYWRFDARRNGYGEWRTRPMTERDAFKAEMRSALGVKRCIPCREVGALHCSDPSNCGGPWDEHKSTGG